MPFSFDKFNEIVAEKKLDIVEDNTDMNYPYMAMFAHLEIDELDFSRLSLEGISRAKEKITESITHENEDGDLLLDPHHPLYQIISLDYKIIAIEDAPKQVVPSSFRFI